MKSGERTTYNKDTADMTTQAVKQKEKINKEKATIHKAPTDNQFEQQKVEDKNIPPGSKGNVKISTINQTKTYNKKKHAENTITNFNKTLKGSEEKKRKKESTRTLQPYRTRKN